MSFTISDDFNVDDVEVVTGENEIEVSKDSISQFFGVTPEVPNVELKLTGKDEKSRTNEISSFILGRIVASIKSGHKRDWVIRHAAKTMDLLAHQAGVELNNSESNAIGLYKKARQFYALSEIRKNVTALNEEYGSKTKSAIINSDKPRFTGALFHAICEQVNTKEPKLDFVYKAGRLEEMYRFDNAVGLKAIEVLKQEASKIVKRAKSENREMTPEECQEVDEFRAEIKSVWSKFFEMSKQVVGSAATLFPEQIATGRTTTSSVFKGISTFDSINFGAFEL